MPMATIEEHPSTSNPLTLTIMFLIQKEMSPIFLQRNTDFTIRFQPTVSSNHINMDDGKTERDKSGWGQYRQGLLLGTYSAPFYYVPAPPRRCMQRMGNFKYETQLFVRSRSSLNRAFDAEILQKFCQNQLYAEQMHPGNIVNALWNQNV